MAQESFDSDDTEYQRAFAALEEIKLTKLRKFFRDNCLRDETLCLMQSEAELKEVLVKDLNLPFGHGFAFSRQWFKKYHGNEFEVPETTSKQLTKTDITNSDQIVNPKQEDEEALPVTVPAKDKNELCETIISRDLTGHKERVENVCPDVYEKRKATTSPLDSTDQTDAQAEQENHLDVAAGFGSVTIDKENPVKEICLEVSFSPEDQRVHSGGPSGIEKPDSQTKNKANMANNEEVPKNHKNQEESLFQTEVSRKNRNEGNELVAIHGLSTKEEAKVLLEVATKPPLETRDPTDAHVEKANYSYPIAKDKESNSTKEQTATSIALSAKTADQAKYKVNVKNNEELPRSDKNEEKATFQITDVPTKIKREGNWPVACQRLSMEEDANVCLDVGDEKKYTKPLLESQDQTDAHFEKANEYDPFANVEESNSTKDHTATIKGFSAKTPAKANSKENVANSEELPKNHKSEEKASVQIDVPSKITNEENELVTSQGFSSKQEANLCLKNGHARKHTKQPLQIQDPTDDPLAKDEESNSTENQTATSRSLSVKDNQNARTIRTSITCEAEESNHKEKMFSTKENARFPCVTHNNDNSNNHGEGTSVVMSNNKTGTGYKDGNRNEALSRDESKFAKKKSTSKLKSKKKKQKKASKNARSAQTPSRDDEDRKEDNDPCLESDDITNMNHPPLAVDGRRMEMVLDEITTLPVTHGHTDLTTVNHDQAPTSDSEVSVNKKKAFEKELQDCLGESVKEVPAAGLKEPHQHRSLEKVSSVNLEAENDERPVHVIQLRDEVADLQKNSTKATRCTPRPHGAPGREHFYERWSVFDVEENREIEFKSFVNAQPCCLPWKIMEKAKKFICGCLNGDRKGIIYFGVGDSQEQGSKYKHGEILGLEVDNYKDDINKTFQSLLDDHIKSDAGFLQKGGEQNCVNLHFVPVKSQENRTNLYVIEIEIARDWRFCKDNVYYSKSWSEKRGGKDDAGKKSLGDLFKIKDEYEDVAVRTNGASSCVKQHEVYRQVKEPLEVKYKEWRRQMERHGDQGLPEDVSLDDADAKRASAVLGERLHGLNHKEYGYILVANKLPAKYRGTANLSFLQNIPWLAVFDLFDPASKTDGLHYACNETSDAPRAKIRTLDDFKDLSLDKDHPVRQTTWILSNDEMQNGDWIKCSKDCLYRALSAYKQCYPPGHLVCVFLCLSESSVHEMADIMESSFNILGNWASSCVTILSETKPVVDAFIKASKFLLQRELRECSITDIPWNLLKEIVREMVGPSNFNERGAMTELPFFTGKLKGVLNKIVHSWNDLEVYSPNPRLPNSAAAIKKERNAFYRGAQASQVNLLHNHSIHRSLEKEITVKVERALKILMKENIDDSCTVKTVTVPYEPGSGATTLCRMILWNKREDYRCAVVKAITSSTDYQIEKLQNILYEENNLNFALPVLVLIDNFLESDIRQVTERVMKRGTKCVVLTTYPIAKPATNSKAESCEITPLRKLDETETSLVKDILLNITSDVGRIKEAEQVLEREKRFIWFGLELFGRDYLKIEERLQNHIHSILLSFLGDSQSIYKSLLETCCFLSKYSAGCTILPHAVLLEFIQHTRFWAKTKYSAIQDVHDIFGGLLLEEQDETSGYYGWRPAHYLVSEVVTSKISIEHTAVHFLEQICTCQSYVVKFLRQQLFRIFLDRKRISDPFFLEDQGMDDSTDLEDDVFGSYEVRTRYSPLVVDILDEGNIAGALRMLIAICGEALQPEDKAYAWQQLARFMGYEMFDTEMNKTDDLHDRLYRAMTCNKGQDTFFMPKTGIEAAHIAVDIAINLHPHYGHHYVTKGDLYRLQLRKPEKRENWPESLSKSIEICRKAFEVYDKAINTTHGFNHYPMIGKIQAILSLLQLVKSLSCFNPEDERFTKYLQTDEIPWEMAGVLSKDEQDYLKGLSSTTLDVFNELFGNVKLKQTTTYDENEIRSLNSAKIRASKLRRAFYKITGYDRRQLNGGQSPIPVLPTTEKEPTHYQQFVEDILFIRDETPYSAWSKLSDREVVAIYTYLKPVCSSGHGSHNDMLIFSKACLQLRERPPVTELDKIVNIWVTKYPNSEWAHLFNYMVHFPVPNKSLAPYNPGTKESIKRCVRIVTEKAGTGFRKSGAEYFLGKGLGLDAIVSSQEFRWLETKWKTKTHFWRSRETTEKLERVRGQKDVALKGVITYQGIKIYFDNNLYPNESKDDLWFYVGFSVAGPYAYDPVDNDTYALICQQTKESTSVTKDHPSSGTSNSNGKLGSVPSHLGRGKTKSLANSSKQTSSPVSSRKLIGVLQRGHPSSSASISASSTPSLGKTYCDALSNMDFTQKSKTTYLHLEAAKSQDCKGVAGQDVPVASKPGNNWKSLFGTQPGTEKKVTFHPKRVDRDGKLRHGAFVLGVRKSQECPRHNSKTKHTTQEISHCKFAHGWLGDTLQSVCTKCTDESKPYCNEKLAHKRFVWDLGPYLNADGTIWKGSKD